MVRLIKAGHRIHVAVLATTLVVLIIAGGALFALAEGIPVTTGWYWAITTATTVGYGDVTPHNPAGRVIASVVMLIAIPMLGALFAIVTGASVAASIRRIMDSKKHFPAGTYRLIVGMHPTVPAILHELAERGDSVVLVTDVAPAHLPDGVHVVAGRPNDPEVIKQADPAGAVHALVTADVDGDMLVSAILLRQQAPDLAITALFNSDSIRPALTALGIDQAVSVDGLVAHTLAKSLEVPHAGGLIEELIDSDTCSLVEVTAEQRVIGSKLSSVRRDHDGLVLALVQNGDVNLGIVDDPVIAAGDRLLVVRPTTVGAASPD